MNTLVQDILQADASEMEELMQAVIRRYAMLFPDWEISTISIDRKAAKNDQLDRMIQMLERMKTLP